jgi:hypothetical protein
LCESLPILKSPIEKTFTSFTFMTNTVIDLEVGQILYNTSYLTDCSLVADGSKTSSVALESTTFASPSMTVFSCSSRDSVR